MKTQKLSDYDFTIFRKSRNLSVAKYGHASRIREI